MRFERFCHKQEQVRISPASHHMAQHPNLHHGRPLAACCAMSAHLSPSRRSFAHGPHPGDHALVCPCPRAAHHSCHLQVSSLHGEADGRS